MTTDAVRSLIREVLAEELGRVARERSPTKETVTIKTNEDLQALVRHIVKISRDKSMREKIAAGDHVFVLDKQSEISATENKVSIASTPSSNPSGVVQITEGFLSERTIEALPASTRVVQLGHRVRFTPLARDRLRQRKITVERI